MYHDPLTLNKYNQTSKIFLIIVMRKHSHFRTKILEAFLTAYQMPLIKIPMKLHKKSLIYLKLL